MLEHYSWGYEGEAGVHYCKTGSEVSALGARILLK